MTLTEMHGVKLQKKLDFLQNSIYKCSCEKLAVHLQWQIIEELQQVFLLENTVKPLNRGHVQVW